MSDQPHPQTPRLNKPLLETRVEESDAVLTMRAEFVHSREAVPAMPETGGGAIASVVSVVAQVAMKEQAAYAASKGAIAQLVINRACEHPTAAPIHCKAQCFLVDLISL